MHRNTSTESLTKPNTSKAITSVYGSNGLRFQRNSRQLNPINKPLPFSPKNRVGDLYTFQRSLFKSKQPNNNPEMFRKTFSIQKKETPRISHSSSKKGIKAMLNTTSNFRPPSTAMRRCVEEEQDNFLSQYEIVKELGKGTYGLVHLAKKKEKKTMSDSLVPLNKSMEEQTASQNKSIEMSQLQDSKPGESLYAIKVYEKFKMNKDPTKFKNIRKEINIMQNIEHPNIIKLYESVDTLTKISLVVEYGGDSSLLDYLKVNFPLSEPTMRKICHQLLSAICYLHEKNIVHRDIKLQNVLMLQEKAKLIDFGFSTLTFKDRKLNAICGTPNYMAPEVLSKKEYIGEHADIWSFGIMAYTIGEGRHPFKAETYNELERLVNKGNYQFKRITNPIHQAFIKRILKVKPSQRPRAVDLLLHPWLSLTE